MKALCYVAAVALVLVLAHDVYSQWQCEDQRIMKEIARGSVQSLLHMPHEVKP